MTAINSSLKGYLSSDSLGSWLAVVGASLAAFSTVGFLNAFGVFQEHFKTLLHGSTDSDISWIGSTGIALMSLLSPVAGMAVDRYGPTLDSADCRLDGFSGREVLPDHPFTGNLLGISMSFIINPGLAVLSRRMPHRRGAAFGFAIGGSSIGGIVWPIMLQQLLYHRGIGFAWTMRISGFVMMLPLGFACVTVRALPRSATSSSVTPEKGNTAANPGRSDARGTVDLSILRDGTFLLLCAGLAVTYLGLLTPLFYISAYSIEHGISSDAAFYLLSGLNAASFIGRVVPGFLADRYGHFNLIIMAASLSALVAFCWPTATTLPEITVLSLAYGFASGGVMSLQAACGSKLGHRGNQGVAIGGVMGSISITALVGTPIAGRILSAYGYLALSMWTGATLSLGAIILTCSRFRVCKEPFNAF